MKSRAPIFGFSVFILLGLFLCACQKRSTDGLGGPRTPFQSQANAILRRLANQVSDARSSKKTMAARAIMSPDGSSHDGLYGDLVLRKAMVQEVSDCVSYTKHIPISAENYLPMVASLTQCLDRLLTYRNPLLTFAFRNLDPESQRHWAYLLNWRRGGGMSSFGERDLRVNSNFASQGYAEDDE